MAHDKCSRNIMDKTMKDFEKRKLKQRDEKVISNRKQAVAVGLSRVEEECKYSSKEYKEVEKSLNKFLQEEPSDKIVLSRVIEARQLIEYFYKEKNLKKCKKFEILLWHYIISAVSKNIEVTQNVWKELKAIKKLEYTRY
jgi:hypothetical protein